MTYANVSLALEELRREYDDVGNQVERLQRDLTALETRHERLGGAIQSLERLNEPNDERSPGDEVRINGTHAEPQPTLNDVAPDGPSVAADSSIAKYIKRGGEGRRLSSTSMVKDLVEELDRFVTREELKDAFFQKFSREDIERFWDRPDNAFGTAVARALKDKLFARGRRKNGTEVYGSHAVAERNRRKAEETASSKPEAEDEE